MSCLLLRIVPHAGCCTRGHCTRLYFSSLRCQFFSSLSSLCVYSANIGRYRYLNIIPTAMSNDGQEARGEVGNALSGYQLIMRQVIVHQRAKAEAERRSELHDALLCHSNALWRSAPQPSVPVSVIYLNPTSLSGSSVIRQEFNCVLTLTSFSSIYYCTFNPFKQFPS